MAMWLVGLAAFSRTSTAALNVGGSVRMTHATWFEERRPSLVDWAQERAAAQDEDLFTVTFSDTGYLEVVINAMVAMSRLDNSMPSKLNLVCLDDELPATLKAMGAPPCYDGMTGWQENFGGLWAFRVRVLEVLVNDAKLDVLLTDSDAIWQRDPRPDLIDRLGTFDVLASQGHFPSEFAHEWRTGALCMGFIAFKRSIATEVFLAQLVHKTKISDTVRYAKKLGEFDDQFAINSLLNDSQIEWLRDGFETSGRAHVGLRKKFNLSVALLPTYDYSRDHCEVAHPEATVVHCVNGGKRTGEAKFSRLHEEGQTFICCADWFDQLRERNTTLGANDYYSDFQRAIRAIDVDVYANGTVL
ncbi:hypothetical protein CTAYLR_005643 [Chrysophaeum taylorii]|uniref:Nucleotide-diphospho-sugar transferase domain-containing protein n=1 Tax=Chrysophaeum taylorii TaxID=2483200 RepID=A0AAD7UMX0_9STRA|nr:hypothetical protein CTAYLR_005643 [Chrysophaeum taylorii]